MRSGLVPSGVAAGLALAAGAPSTTGVLAWSSPAVKVAHNSHGISAFDIDGEISAPGFLVGNIDSAQGNITMDHANWKYTVKLAAKAGVRIFGISCDDPFWQAQARPDTASVNAGELPVKVVPPMTVYEVTRSSVKAVIAAWEEAAAEEPDDENLQKNKPLMLCRTGMSVGPASMYADDPELQKAITTPGLAMNRTNATQTAPFVASLTDTYAKYVAPRLADMMRALDDEFPGYIGGIHLCSLLAGENTYNWQPGDWGWPDYGPYMVVKKPMSGP